MGENNRVYLQNSDLSPYTKLLDRPHLLEENRIPIKSFKMTTIAMKPAYTLILLFALLISACAPMGSSIIIENKTMTNSRPPFSLQFTEQPIEILEEGSFREFHFVKDNRLFVAGYNRWIESSKIESYYSLSGLVAEFNFEYMGAAHFADHEWAKIVKYDNISEVLSLGYLTRKDNNIILVLSINQDIERNIKGEFEEFIKTQKMSDSIRKEIDSQFEYLDSKVEILY